jgi:hypothetical protein
VPGRILAGVLSGKDPRDLTSLSIIAAKQKSGAFIRIGFFTVRVDLSQNFI